MLTDEELAELEKRKQDTTQNNNPCYQNER